MHFSVSQVPEMEEVPQWQHGHTGPLKCGRKLSVVLRRTEGELWVNAEYHVDVAEATEVFNAFLGLRFKYRSHKYARPGESCRSLPSGLRSCCAVRVVRITHSRSTVAKATTSMHYFKICENMEYGAGHASAASSFACFTSFPLLHA